MTATGPFRSTFRRLSLVLPLLSTVFGLSALLPPAAGARPLDPGAVFTSGLDLVPRPEGGFLAIWRRDAVLPGPPGPDLCEPGEIVGAVLSEEGVPLEGPVALTFGGEPDAPSMVRLAGARLRDSFFPAVAYTTPAGLKIGRLTGDFRVTSTILVSDCAVQDFELESRGIGTWLVWRESCHGERIRGRRFDLVGAPSGPAVTLVENAPAGPAPGFAAATDVGADLFLAWVEAVPGDPAARRVVAARFGPGGARQTVIRTVSGSLHDADEASGALAAALVSDPPERRLVVAWRSDAGAIRLRSFSPELEAVAEVRVADGDTGQGARPLLASAFDLLAVAWETPSGAAGTPDCPIRAFDAGLRPLGGPAGLAPSCEAPEALAFPETPGLPLAGWRPSSPTGGPCARTAVAVAQISGLPPIPPGPAIESPELPGFRFHVRIGGDEASPRTGNPEPLCVPETVCVSGALPGRTEVLVRIVGPKPNGYLWPTIVRLTTSQVEVWIEQLATEAIRYYRLPGASPGSGELDGLFDRGGFLP